MSATSSDRVRVVLIGLGGMVADIVTGVLADANDIELVAGFWGAPDVAILGDDRVASRHSPDDLLRQHPLLKVLTVSGDGREAALYELRPHRTILGEASPQTLLEAVRTART